MSARNLESPKDGPVSYSANPELPRGVIHLHLRMRRGLQGISLLWRPNTGGMATARLLPCQIIRWDGESIIRDREGLKGPKKQPKRGRLWPNDGSCIRLRPEHKDHVWSYDFMAERTNNGRASRILSIIDEFTRECLRIKVNRNISSHNVIDELFSLFIFRGIPEHIRSDNGPEFTATAVTRCLSRLGVKSLLIEGGRP